MSTANRLFKGVGAARISYRPLPYRRSEWRVDIGYQNSIVSEHEEVDPGPPSSRSTRRARTRRESSLIGRAPSQPGSPCPTHPHTHISKVLSLPLTNGQPVSSSPLTKLRSDLARDLISVWCKDLTNWLCALPLATSTRGGLREQANPRGSTPEHGWHQQTPASEGNKHNPFFQQL